MTTYTLNFPNGNSQTYPSSGALMTAARALGGKAVLVSTSGGNHIYAFQSK